MAKDNNYDASSITVLEGLEAVRKRPGMYIGSVSTKGLNHLIYEIVDNSVDEHLTGYCDTIKVTLEADGSATVEDNGRGIPVGMHEKGISAERLVFTTLHAGGKFDNSAYKTSGGLHGVGSSVVNALSTKLTVRVKSGGCIYEDRYERGIPAMDLWTVCSLWWARQERPVRLLTSCRMTPSLTRPVSRKMRLRAAFMRPLI